MKKTLLSLIPLCLAFASCAGLKQQVEISNLVHQRMENYIYETSLPDLKKSVIDDVLTKRSLTMTKESGSIGRKTPLKQSGFIYDGKLHTPLAYAGEEILPGVSLNTKVTTDSPKNSPFSPYDLVVDNTDKFLIIYDTYAYEGRRVGMNKCQLVVKKMEKLHQSQDQVKLNMLGAVLGSGFLQMERGIIDLDQSLFEAKRTLPVEWNVLQRVDQSASNRLYQEAEEKVLSNQG